ncbi:serine/threonine-protein kinase Nek2-like isoform X1 [Branchiostoma floridae]|uniref:Serine/threonine-protein kinase Nek2 n=1 Tax=Branchiostoma floridae TaxID=7739 RepID=C3Y0I8_BRAFL|nr:serine/threonine-protein kinase Nek2-like isoform X1 [Branchiostoma floridae]|eukprot:XP_002610251.1 hypothetical protein BRAFLDRAFT_115429 [Branchiostoma floridae]
MPTSRLEDYEVLYTIGTGSYGTCKKVRRRTDGKVLVWKEMDYGTMSEAEKSMLVSEVNLLRELKHQHIVRYYDRIIDRSNTTIYIVMEYCEGGDLASLISRCRRERRYLEEDMIWKLFFQICLALKECHNRRDGKTFLHRDLKPANVFLDANKDVKLGDFGLARVLAHDTSFAKTFVGTPYYMSPEQMNNMSYNEKSDIWSLGCLIYELCSLSPPFLAANQKQLAVRVREGKYRRVPYQYSDELNSVIGSMLNITDDRRPDIETLLQTPQLASRLREYNGKNDKAEAPRRRSREDVGDRRRSREKEDLLKQREDALVARERSLEDKEKEVEAREKNLAVREKIVEDKLARAESLMKQYTELAVAKANRALADFDINADDTCTEKSPSKKKVHFSILPGKENERADDDLGSSFISQYNGYKAGGNKADLKARLDRARIRGVALKHVEANATFKSRQLLGMR